MQAYVCLPNPIVFSYTYSQENMYEIAMLVTTPEINQMDGGGSHKHFWVKNLFENLI